MKRILLLAALTLTTAHAELQQVQGYTRRDGTYVQPYMRSKPDDTTTNNLGNGWNRDNNPTYVAPTPSYAPSYNSPSYGNGSGSYNYRR